MTDWLMPSEISTALGQPGFKGPKALTQQKVGRAIRDLGFVDNPDVCRSVEKAIEQSSTGRTYTQRYYDFAQVEDAIRDKLVEIWPDLMLREDAEIPEYVVEREAELADVAPPEPKEKPTEKKWSEYQLAIFDEAKKGTGNVVVIARAGSGKTTTIINAIDHLPPGKRTLLCAFNKDIQVEMEQRAPKSVMVRTIHSLGFELCRQHFGRKRGLGSKGPVDQFKVHKIVDTILRSDSGREKYKKLTTSVDRFTGHKVPGGDYKDAKKKIVKLVSLCKNMLAIRQGERLKIYFEYNIGDTWQADLMCQCAGEVLKVNDEDHDTIDYDDMIYFPFRHGMAFGTMKFDVVMVDEAQDLNAAQLWFVQQLCRKNGRIIALGDDRQAIYGFRGADRHAIPKLIDGLDAKTMPLSVSYRCPRSVVALAREVVADIEWAPNAPEGVIASCDFTEVLREARPGDFVLSRLNAPLIGTCMAMLKASKPCIVAGKDIGASIEALVRRAKAGTPQELHEWLDRWLEKEKEDSLPDRVEHFQNCVDKANVVRLLIDQTGSINGLIVKLNALFSDDTDENKILCSTVHKAKGMERDKVWMLQDTFRPNADVEEANIWYVSVTRAKKELYLCETPIEQIVAEVGGIVPRRFQRAPRAAPLF